MCENIVFIDCLGAGSNSHGKYLGDDVVSHRNKVGEIIRACRGIQNRIYGDYLAERLVQNSAITVRKMYDNFFEGNVIEKSRVINRIAKGNAAISIVFDSSTWDYPKNKGIGLYGVLQNDVSLLRNLSCDLRHKPFPYEKSEYIHRYPNCSFVNLGNLYSLEDYERLSDEKEVKNVCEHIYNSIIRDFKFIIC